jgi:hypothetical protein
MVVAGAMVVWNVTGPWWGTAGGVFGDTVPVGGSVVVETGLFRVATAHFLTGLPSGVTLMGGWFRLGNQLAYRARFTRPGVVRMPGLWFIYRTDGIPRLGWYPAGETRVVVLGRYPWSRGSWPPVRYRGRAWAVARLAGIPWVTTWLVDSTVGQVRDALGRSWFPRIDATQPVSLAVAKTPHGPWIMVAENLETGQVLEGSLPQTVTPPLAELGQTVGMWSRTAHP